jgi:hypothetical protein
MYTNYTIALSGDIESCILTYTIQEHEAAQVWASLMKQVDVSSLRDTLNPWQNFNIAGLPQKIDRLEILIDELNSWLPEDKNIRKKWNHADHQESVNRLHVHFPEQEKSETDKDRLRQLSEYNDLIHEIEGLTRRPNQPSPYLLICPDGLQDITLNDYSRFKAQRYFGELCLHYCHVGRHPFELYSARDISCPIEQIIPQHAINTYHTLRFHDDDYLEHWYKPNFRRFYELSTLKQKIQFDDPKMAFGYIPLGTLEKVNDSVDFTKELVYTLVSNCNKIDHWEIH